MAEKPPPVEPAESPAAQPVDSTFPLVLNLHGELPIDGWDAPEFIPQTARQAVEASPQIPGRPDYVPLNWETCYFPKMDMRDGAYHLSDDALLQWFDLEIEQMEHMEFMTGESDGIGPLLRENAGGDTVGDAYQLIALLNKNGWNLKLQEPAGPFTPHDALRELRRIRDALVTVCDGRSTDAETSDEPQSETENNDFEHLVGRINVAMLDDNAGRILAIANEREWSSDKRMREICDIDPRFYGKQSLEWSSLLGVTEQAIRKTLFWKEIRSWMTAKGE